MAKKNAAKAAEATTKTAARARARARMGVYELLADYLFGAGGAATLRDFRLLSVAEDVDRAHQQIIDSVDCARRGLASLAENASYGFVYTSNPLGSGALYDLPMLVAGASVQRDAFWGLVSDRRDEDGPFAARVMVVREAFKQAEKERREAGEPAAPFEVYVRRALDAARALSEEQA